MIHKVNNYFLLLIVNCSLLIVLSSCDKIDHPYVKQSNNTNNDSSKYVRHVLLEEFTASQCGYCPDAHKILETLQLRYTNQLISYSIHAGELAVPSGDFVIDFRSQAGNDIDRLFKISSSLPGGMINRKIYNNVRAVDPEVWGEKIEDILDLPPKIDIQLFNNYDISGRNLTSSVFIHSLDTISASLMLCVYIVEDSIKALQESYTPSRHQIQNYVNRNVLRGSMNGTWGEDLKNKPLQKDQFITKNYQFTLSNDLNYQQVYTIAFVYNKITQEVIQCEKVKIYP